MSVIMKVRSYFLVVLHFLELLVTQIRGDNPLEEFGNTQDNVTSMLQKR